MTAGAEHALLVVLSHLAEAAVRACALGAIAALGLFLFRVRSAAIHLVVWTTVLCGALVIPAIGELVPATRSTLTIALPPNRTSNSAASDARTIGSRQPPAPAPFRILPDANELPESPTVRAAVRTASAPHLSWTALVAIAYLAGVVWLLARVIVGWIVSARLWRLATAIEDALVMARLQECASAAGLRRPPRLFEIAGLFVPVTTGVVKPAILLPTDWREWDAAKLDAVLVHELSHLARRDTLVQRLSLLYRALYWFSPFGWWLHRHVVALGDCASDEAVLATGIDRVVYAETLLEFFAAIRDVPRRVDWHVAMASGRSAQQRVDRILNWQGRRVGPLTNLAAIAIVVTLAPVVVVAASGRATLASTDLPVVPAAPDLLPAVGVLPAHSAESTEPIHVASAQQTAPVAPAPTLDRVYVGPPGHDDLAGRQLIVFLFDLRTLPGDDLKRAADTASVYVNDLWRRAESGADIFHVAAVQTVGATVETVQDFTWDKEAVQAALSRVRGGAATTPVGNAAVRLQAMTAMCDALSQRGPSARIFYGSSVPLEFMKLVDTKSVLYFGNGPLRGQDSVAELARVVSACTKPNLSSYVVGGATFFDLPSPLQPLVGLSITVVRHQADSPVVMSGSASADPFGGFLGAYVSLAVRNNSAKKITSLTVAALVRPNDPGIAAPLIYRTHLPSGPTIPAGQVVMVGTRLINQSIVNNLGVDGAKAEVGIVEVEFEDGSHWSYDLEANGKFALDRDADVPAPSNIDVELDAPRLRADLSRGLAELQRALDGRIDPRVFLRGLLTATGVDANDPFAAGAHRLDETGLVPPRLDPVLSLASWRLPEMRVVGVDAVVDDTGKVVRARIARSVDRSPNGIDEHALDLVRGATFTPARLSGAPVTVLVRVPVLVR